MVSCSAGDNKPAKTKLSIFVCEDHYNLGKEGLIDVIKGLRSSTTPTPVPTPTTTPSDRYGIRKIYPDAVGTVFQEWYMNHNDPTSDPKFKNWTRANLKKQSDGSWSSDGMGAGSSKGQVRLEGWSASGSKKWLNCECTVYSQYVNDLAGSTTRPGAYAFQVYRGGGHHSTKTPCDGACYKGRVRKDQSVTIVKEVIHPDYTSNRGGIKKLSSSPKGRYIGTKLVVYNIIENGKTYPKIQVWIDEQGMSPNGVFDKNKQNWVLMAQTIDRGGWSSGNGGGCPKLNKDSTASTRRGDEIFNMPGGTSAGNLCAYRTDGVLSKIKYFSIREIKPPV